MDVAVDPPLLMTRPPVWIHLWSLWPLPDSLPFLFSLCRSLWSRQPECYFSLGARIYLSDLSQKSCSCLWNLIWASYSNHRHQNQLTLALFLKFEILARKITLRFRWLMIHPRLILCLNFGSLRNLIHLDLILLVSRILQAFPLRTRKLPQTRFPMAFVFVSLLPLRF